MWISRHVDEHGRLWGIVMAGDCPWCVLRVSSPSERHAHALKMDQGIPLPLCVPASQLGLV